MGDRRLEADKLEFRTDRKGTDRETNNWTYSDGELGVLSERRERNILFI